MSDPAGPRPDLRGRWSVEARSRCSATMTDVWPLIGEAHRWKDWSFLTRSDLVRSGTPPPDGVGAIRKFSRFGVGSREQVLEWDPPRHLAYTILSGFPVRNYRADVTLGRKNGGTEIVWTATFDEKVPATGRLMVAMVQRMLDRFVSSLAAYVDRHHPPGI